jgi:ribonuclease HI
LHARSAGEGPLTVKIHVDGGARGNPGPAGAGVVLRDAADEAVLMERGYYLGEATNNVAEYRGLIAALQLAVDLGARGVEVCSDSELLVRQVNGQYRVKAAHLKPLFARVRELAAPLEAFTVRHVRREQNTEADRLANLAMDRRGDVDGGELT